MLQVLGENKIDLCHRNLLKLIYSAQMQDVVKQKIHLMLSHMYMYRRATAGNFILNLLYMD